MKLEIYIKPEMKTGVANTTPGLREVTIIHCRLGLSQGFSLLAEHPDYTYEDLAWEIGKTRETVRTSLRKLEALNLIRRIGSDKKGHWKILLPHTT